MNMEIPEVRACDESRCAYNVEQSCHARAVTIGDDDKPMCDTFFSSSRHAHNTKQTAGVGACKISGCRHNDDFECQADHIDIQTPNGQARCMTFAS
ncbi:hypothetical protein Tel_12515 [Candidatus Tenderia electrophaga]|uniref:DUF1540 domain-containing protein n=1 Tax=Candidatus Tenderia electrophaga TaxID=1748243 RepID=A0A0S2TI67_9GAMM|nr:hypothetical protein Tel_12515 [Candidatus Tenderia electrophaga]